MHARRCGALLALLLGCACGRPVAAAEPHALDQEVSRILGDVVGDHTLLRPGAALEWTHPLGLSHYGLLVRPELYAGEDGEIGTGVSLGLDVPLSTFHSNRTIAFGVRLSATPLTPSERAGAVAFDRPTLRVGREQNRLLEIMLGNDVMRHPDEWAQNFSLSMGFTTWF